MGNYLEHDMSMPNNNNLDNSTIVTSSKVIWSSMQASTLILAPCIYFMDKFLQFDPIAPDLKIVFLLICAASIPLAFTLNSKFRLKEREITANLYSGAESPRPLLQSYIKFLIIGLALCNFPAMFGLVLYLISGDVNLSMSFVAVGFGLGFLYKPAV